MLSRILANFTRSNTITHLGRWNTIIKETDKDIYHINKAIEKNAYWGNHDHCGSELCKTPTPYNNKKTKVR